MTRVEYAELFFHRHNDIVSTGIGSHPNKQTGSQFGACGAYAVCSRRRLTENGDSEPAS